LLLLGLAYLVQFADFGSEVYSREEPTMSCRRQVSCLLVALAFLIYVGLVMAKALDRKLGLGKVYKRIKYYSKEARTLHYVVFPIFTSLLGIIAPQGKRAPTFVAIIFLSVFTVNFCQNSKKMAPSFLGLLVLIFRETTLTAIESVLILLALGCLVSGIKLKR